MASHYFTQSMNNALINTTYLLMPFLSSRRSIFVNTLICGNSNCIIAESEAKQPLIYFAISEMNCHYGKQNQKKHHYTSLFNSQQKGLKQIAWPRKMAGRIIELYEQQTYKISTRKKKSLPDNQVDIQHICWSPIVSADQQKFLKLEYENIALSVLHILKRN